MSMDLTNYLYFVFIQAVVLLYLVSCKNSHGDDLYQ